MQALRTRAHRYALAVSVAMLLASGCKHDEASTVAAASAAPIVPVVKATHADLANEVVLTAEFTPFQNVAVMAKVAGYVQAIHVDIGDHVHTGQVLATLEVPELQDELGRVRAAEAGAQAGISTAQGALERTNAAASIAHLSYQRIEDVAAKNPGLVPKQEVDVAESHDLEAKAQVASAQAALVAARQAQQGAAEDLHRAQAMLAYATIRAPFDGVVTNRYANTGSMIQAGTASQTQAMPIVDLAEDQLLRLRFPVPVADAPQIHVGEAVEVSVTTLHRTFPGTITRFADLVNTSTRTMETEVDVPNPGRLLIPGMYAEVRLPVAAAANALSVPLDAVEGLGSNSTSAYVARGGRVAVMPVSTGVQTPARVQVLSGLEAGDLVIVGRHSGLSAGEAVQTRPAGYE